MLVSLAIVALAAVLVSAGVGRIAYGLDRSAETDRQIDAIATAQFVLRRRVAVMFPAKDVQTGNTIEFLGKPDSVDFLAPGPDNTGPDALQRYRVRLAQDGALTLYRISSLSSAIDPRQASTAGWQATPLIGGVSALAISYYGPPPDGSAMRWQPQWVHRQSLPLLVRLRVDMADAASRAWPDLVIHVRAATGDTCERDAKTDQCKGSL